MDGQVRPIDGGRVLLGGSPLRFLRLSPAGVAALADVEAGRPGVPAAFVDRLVERGVLHPVLEPTDALAAADLTVVIPVRDRADALDRCLRALTATPTLEREGPSGSGNLQSRASMRVIVVDDGSIDAPAHAAVAARHGVELVRLELSVGPAGARNVGWRRVATPLVAFVDSDVEIGGADLQLLAGHLGEHAVALAAPRIRDGGDGANSGDGVNRPGASVIDRYERAASSLDLGERSGPIRPRTRIAYVPAAVMVLSIDALRSIDGFDESLQVGEDVDLCWRLDRAGRRCRYDPSITALHQGRSSARSWLSRIRDYGTSAAALDERHPAQVAPVTASRWSAGVWAALAAGHPLVAVAAAVGSAELLRRKLTFLERPRFEAYRLVGVGHLGAGRLFGQALVRPYWPVTLVACLLSQRARRVAPVAVVVPVLLEYRERRPELDPLRFTVLRIADHVAYSAGVWQGAWSRRGLGALRPAGARN